MKIFISRAALKLLSHIKVQKYFFLNLRPLQCFRSDITVVCKAMEFGQFPLDKHKCYFILTSCKLLLTSVLGWGIQTINYVQPRIEKLSSRVFSLCKQEVMRQLGGGYNYYLAAPTCFPFKNLNIHNFSLLALYYIKPFLTFV